MAVLGLLLQATSPAAEPAVVRGSAKVSCTLSAVGQPKNCEVLSEQPAGSGFGGLAVRWARSRIHLRRSGESPSPTVVIPFQFELTAQEAAEEGVVFSGPPLITEPVWIRKPSGEDVERVYPSEARRRNIGGKARVWCRVAPSGWMEQCRALEEEPPGIGYGAAAAQLALGFRMGPRDKTRQPTAGRPVIIPITLVPPR